MTELGWAAAGTLAVEPAPDRPDLLAPSVAEALARLDPDRAARVGVAPIDADLADTAAFCAAYGIGLDISANCVVVLGKRAGVERFAACLVLATTRADVNGVVRRTMDVRSASFAPTDTATSETGMEYGGITPLGLPASWPILVDRAVADAPLVVVGSGIRGSKLLLPGALVAELPGATVIDGLGQPIQPA